MTALTQVWSPADFAETVAALQRHEAVAVPGGGLLLPPKRGRWYRGKHRAGRRGTRVASLDGDDQ